MVAQSRKWLAAAKKVVKRLKRPAAGNESPGVSLELSYSQSHEGAAWTVKEIQSAVRQQVKCAVTLQAGTRRGQQARIRLCCKECQKGMCSGGAPAGSSAHSSHKVGRSQFQKQYVNMAVAAVA